ncbi:hypothetical protein Tco_0198899 [Tanacetum coccineum]
MESLNSNSQERERVASVATNARQCKGKLHDIFLATSFISTEKLFVEYTGIKVKQFRETLLLHIGNVKKSVAKRTRHKRQYDRRMKERQMQSKESKVVSSKALDDSLVVTECSGKKSDEHITSSSSGTYITHVVDVDIRPVNDQVPSAEVHLTAQHNVFANEQQHTDQSEPSYDTYLLEKVDSNTTPDSINMCHRGGEIDQDAEHDQVKSPLLKAEFLKTNDMVEKEVYNELSNRFLQLEKHCISLEISMQQKEESFQSNKPCKNQDAPEFCEFFEINDLKAQLQAKTTLICNLKNQIKSVKEASNEAKVKHEIDVLETINIELESSVAKLLAENEKLNKENEHLKQTYKELYDSIKKTRIQTKDHNDSLIAQVNSKTVENADLKAQIQEKVFANVALKNELRKLKGNMDTKFGKTINLGETIEPPNGSNDDTLNPHEGNQTLYVSAVSFKEFKSDDHASMDVLGTKQFRPRPHLDDRLDSKWFQTSFLNVKVASVWHHFKPCTLKVKERCNALSEKMESPIFVDISLTDNDGEENIPAPNLQEEMNRSFIIAQNITTDWRRETFSKSYRSWQKNPIFHIS